MALHNETSVKHKSEFSLIRNFVQFDFFVNGRPVAATGKGVTSQMQAERIRTSLGLKEVSISSLPVKTATIMADIAVKHLCQFQCNLQLITTRNKWGGNYCPETGNMHIGCTMSLEETVATFIHEYAHAVHYAALSSPETKDIFSRELRRIRKENIDCLERIFKEAVEHVPCLGNRFKRVNSTVPDRVRSMIRGIEDNFEEVPITISAEFSRNLASIYALKNNTEYFSEYFTDYLLNPEPSIFVQRVWQLAKKTVHDYHVKVAPDSTWLNHAEFFCRQGLISAVRCEIIAWVCDSNWNFLLPGITDVKSHSRLQAHIHGNRPAKERSLPRPHIFDVPVELGLSFKKILLIPKYYQFYYHALDAAIKHGVTNLTLPLFFDPEEISFKHLIKDLKEINQLLKSALFPLRRITFVTPLRSLAVHLKTYLPVTLEHILLDNVTLKAPVRLTEIKFTQPLNPPTPISQILNLPDKWQKKPKFSDWMACVEIALGTDQPLAVQAKAIIVYTSEHSNLFSKQISSMTNANFEYLAPKQSNCVPNPALLKLEGIVEQEKLRLYRMVFGNVIAIQVPIELKLKVRYLILVPRSQPFRHKMFLAALKMADTLKVSELAVPYYMYAHAGKVAQDLVDDLSFTDKEFGCKPEYLRKITFCAHSRKDYAPFMLPHNSF